MKNYVLTCNFQSNNHGLGHFTLFTEAYIHIHILKTIHTVLFTEPKNLPYCSTDPVRFQRNLMKAKRCSEGSPSH